jgi:HK97 family phage prohead protease
LLAIVIYFYIAGMEQIIIPPYATKHTYSEVKNIDEKAGIVDAYANVYGNEDWDKDISAQGSFTKTVDEQKRKIRVFKNHDSRLDIGIPLEINAKDDFGLFTRTKFNLDRPDAKDVFLMVTDRMQHEKDADLSIGYEVVKRDEKDRRIIKEYKLYEYSFLSSWGANPLATATGAKAVDLFLKQLVRYYDLNLSTEKLKQIETILKALEVDEPSDDTPKTIEPFSLASFGKFSNT